MDSARGGARGGGRIASKPKGDEYHLESGGYLYNLSNHHHQNHRHQYFSGVIALKILLLFMVIGITSLILDRSTYPPKFFRRSFSIHQFITENLPSPAKEDNELETMLRKAAMKDKKTVIITTLNAAWSEPNSIFDLFLEGFRIGNGTQQLLKHVVVATLDRKAHSRCMEEQLHCYAVTTDGVDFSAHKLFMTDDYLKMMWRRIDLLRVVLEMGYNFVFTDADVVWLRDPFPRFYSDGDFQISCDFYWFNSTDVNNAPNGGFNYVKSNNRTIQFYKFWYTAKDYFPNLHDQQVFNEIKSNPFIDKIGLEIRFLDTAYFGGFCEPSKDLDLVITMHANCCIGLKYKIHDIKMVIDDWRKYLSLSSGVERNLSSRSWTVPRSCQV